MRDYLRTAFALIQRTFTSFMQDQAIRQAAALAYYTVFSIAPLLLLTIAVAGLFLGRETVQTEVINQTRGLIGEGGADVIQQVLSETYGTRSGLLPTLFGLGFLIFGASNVFTQLKLSLNHVWGVDTVQENAGILNLIRTRLVSLAMVLVIGFLLIVSLIISAAVQIVFNSIEDITPGVPLLVQVANFFVSFGIVTLLFAMIYKTLPDLHIKWRDVWIGAAVTSLLFSIGKWAIGFYIGNSGVASAYGAAGSLVVVLLWVYYSAAILMFGAEFTKVYARDYGETPQTRFRAREKVQAEVMADAGEDKVKYTAPEPERVVIETRQVEPQHIVVQSSNRWFGGFISGVVMMIGSLVAGLLLIGRD